MNECAAVHPLSVMYNTPGTNVALHDFTQTLQQNVLNTRENDVHLTRSC